MPAWCGRQVKPPGYGYLAHVYATIRRVEMKYHAPCMAARWTYSSKRSICGICRFTPSHSPKGFAYENHTLGWGVHALVAGRKLILGGVEVPFHRALLGHIDADAPVQAMETRAVVLLYKIS